jgi:hypothetical protein
MAVRKNKRGPSLDDKYMGPEPIFSSDSEFTDTNWAKAARWYGYFYKNKDYMPSIISFVEKEMGYTKKKISVLKRLRDYHFIPVGKRIKLFERGWQYKEEDLQNIKDFISDSYKIALKEKEKVEAEKSKVKVISPQERTRIKVLETIYADWDSEIIEGWIDGDYTKKFSAYNRFKMHGLKSNAINIFKSMIDEEYESIKSAYERTDDQCVEAYSHISKGDKNKILKQFEAVYSDLERLRDAFRATRSPRLKKPKSSDRQVEKLKYLKEDIDSKLVSINPILIPGKHKLFVYNVKQRKLIEYVTSSVSGFEVSGTTIKNFDGKSRSCTLRKPEDILPQILNKTERQIDNIWDGLTTKITKPTGRINADCILMRTF